MTGPILLLEMTMSPMNFSTLHLDYQYFWVVAKMKAFFTKPGQIRFMLDAMRALQTDKLDREYIDRLESDLLG